MFVTHEFIVGRTYVRPKVSGIHMKCYQQSAQRPATANRLYQTNHEMPISRL
ncbi:hypothetical protein NIES2111_49930 [Nostoc sp. NIES-2111]|nr:hypothetical protein NIES2111_49930 [Nostoc sp. NIES-2111]